MRKVKDCALRPAVRSASLLNGPCRRRLLRCFSGYPIRVSSLNHKSFGESIMKFIEMTGRVLKEIVKDDELHVADLSGAGIVEDTIVRINQQGDIEVRRTDRWDCIGGLLGNYEQRLQKRTGLDWA